MRRSTQRLLLLLAMVPLSLVAFAFVYMEGMAHLEGHARTIWESLEWAAETLTTTGYGQDAHWQDPRMVLFVILVQFAGLFLIFMILPVYVLPFFEERFEARVPRALPHLEGEILIFQYGPPVASLVAELRSFHRPYLIVESEEPVARRLLERGHKVILMDLNEDRFQAGQLTGAQALVANGSDDENAILTMAAREVGFEGQVVALAEDPLHRHAMTQAGANVVFTPRHVLAAALAARASQRINPSVSGVQQIGANIAVAQLRVTADSRLAGRTLEEVGIRETMGATVIGLWNDGKLIDQPNGDTRLYARSILIAIGSHPAIARLGELATATPLDGPLVVAGYGEVGAKVAELLRDAGEEVLVVNDRAEDGVDIVGNLLRQQTLKTADIRNARAVILTIGNDSESLFAAAILRDYAPDVPLYARVNLDQSVERLHRLGVDFALSVGQVSGRLLVYHLLGEDYVSVEPSLRVVSADADRLVGNHPWRAGVREKTGCQIVAVGRGTAVFVEFEEDFTIAEGDVLYVCGSEQALASYFEVYPVLPHDSA